MAADGCIVHCNKKVLEFYDAFNQLRREKKYHAHIYQQLLIECCSCDGKTDLKEIDLKILRKMCHDIQLSWAFKVHVPFTKNLNKLTLKKRSNSKKKHILRNAIKTELEHQFNEGDGEWDDYEDDLYYKGSYDILGKRADSSRYQISQLTISSKYFQPIVAFDGCIVHDNRYLSEFRHAVKELRRVSNFHQSIYNQLSEKCCSCNGKEGLNVIDPIILRDICYEIEPDPSNKQESNESIDFMRLSFGSSFNLAEQRKKIGLFIGKKGRHISAVQNKYNVRVNVVIGSSSMKLRRELTEVLNNSGTRYRYSTNELYVLLTKMDTSIEEKLPMDEIKQTLSEMWNKISQSEHFQAVRRN